MSANYVKERNLENRLNRILAKEMFDFSCYKKIGRKAANLLKKEIKGEREISIDRSYIFGSVGKGTSLGSDHSPDLDIVLLLNEIPNLNGERPFDEILNIIAKAASRVPGFTVNYLSSFTVNCTYKTKRSFEIDFDVVPGFNLVRKSEADSHPSQTNMERALSKLSKDPERLEKWFSSSLVETTLNFVRRQSKFVRDAAILAKLWSKAKVIVDERIPGRSYTIELMAIKTAQEEVEKYGKNAKHIRAFVRFLRIFDQRKKKVNVQFDFKCNPNSYAYRKFKQMQKTKGKVLDPANPYNNLLKGFNGPAWTIFNQRARQALVNIERDGEFNRHNRSRCLEYCFRKS